MEIAATERAWMAYRSLRNRFYVAESLFDRHLGFLLGDLSYRPLAAEPRMEGPCVYLLRFTGTHGLYRVVPGRRQIVYVGSSQSATRRIRDHRRSLKRVADLSLSEFQVGLIGATSPEMSRYLEARLIAVLDPPWNRREWAGFGSKPQGRLRQGGQRSSAWDRLHPGRP